MDQSVITPSQFNEPRVLLRNTVAHASLPSGRTWNGRQQIVDGRGIPHVTTRFFLTLTLAAVWLNIIEHGVIPELIN